MTAVLFVTVCRTACVTAVSDRYQVVIDACGGKRQCQLRTSASLFGVDPCPGISKFVEVLYKCRPSKQSPLYLDRVLKVYAISGILMLRHFRRLSSKGPLSAALKT